MDNWLSGNASRHFFTSCIDSLPSRGSIDCVQLINEEHLITGADDGWGRRQLVEPRHFESFSIPPPNPPLTTPPPSLSSSVCLWSVNKKKPLTTVKKAHGCHGDDGLEQPHWVSSVAALQNSDTVASGASGCERRPHTPLTDTSGRRSLTLVLSFSSAGSHNSMLQLWKCQLNYRGLEPLFSVSLVSRSLGLLDVCVFMSIDR